MNKQSLAKFEFSKKVVYVFLAVLILLAGGVFWASRSRNSTPDSALVRVEPQDVQVSPEIYDLGKIPMKNGFVTREYEIKNNSENILRVKKIATSCMCTRAQIVLENKRTRFYGMEMGGAKNPNINFDIPGKTTAKLNVRFDPAAHGPAGVGAFERSVWLTFADPVGIKEVKFFGEVVLQ